MEKNTEEIKVKAHFGQVLSPSIKISMLKYEILGVTCLLNRIISITRPFCSFFLIYINFNAMTGSLTRTRPDQTFSTYLKFHENRIQEWHTATRSVFLCQNELLCIINDTP